MDNQKLLIVDAAVNLLLGILLLLVPFGAAAPLGVPIPMTPFYALLLGAVLFGIGLALLVERYKARLGVTGLGLGGAICINICGAGTLVIWLLFGSYEIPTRGLVILWAIAILVLGLSLVELLAGRKQ